MTLSTDEPVIADRLLKVLVVDDTFVNRQIFQVFLERLGFQCLMAEDGDQAIQIFKTEQPDIVLMDVMMPHLNGYDATRQIRELSGDRWVPIIFVSALDREENLIDGLEAGGDDFMSKPINFVVLDAKMRSLRRMVDLQHNLEASRRRSDAITENIVDGVITINEFGIVQSVNPAAAKMFGYAVDELVGCNVSKLMPPADAKNHDDYLARYAAGGPAHIVGIGREVNGLRKNGEVFTLELGVSDIHLPDQRLFVGVLRDITERKQVEQRLRDNALRLSEYHSQQEREHALTREIIERQMSRPGLLDPCIRHWITPAADFSGDIVAAARCKDGKLYALLADGAGHGLAAAVSALPVLTVFYGVLEHGSGISMLVGELNRQLRASLPVGRFVGAIIVCIDEQSAEAEIWNGGMPPLLWLDRNGQIKEALKSEQLPLGIVDTDASMLVTRHIHWQSGERLLACSDGLLERITLNGGAFGSEGLSAALTTSPSPEHLLEHIQQSLLDAAGAGQPDDDVSVLMIHCLQQTQGT